MKKPPKRVLRCTTHHACDCIQYRSDQMTLALRIIRTWAKCWDERFETPERMLEHIVKKCDEVL